MARALGIQVIQNIGLLESVGSEEEGETEIVFYSVLPPSLIDRYCSDAVS